MNFKFRASHFIFLLLFCCAASATATFAQLPASKVPAEVNSLVGNFIGSWTSYTLSDKGEVVKQAAWTDIIKAEKPGVSSDRAFVETIDDMNFEGGRIPPQKVAGKEGYLLNKDGSLGDYFIESFGQTIPMKRLSKDVWAYSIPATAREFMALGDRFLSGTHTLVKTTTFDQGVEIHNVTRVTVARWKDAEGKERLTSFVSLSGQHRKAQ